MRSPPEDLARGDLIAALAGGWGLRGAGLAYVPQGGGGHHWRLVCDDGQPWFVTVDDLDGKSWLGSDRETVFGGLGVALATAAALRDAAGLEFVLAPVAAGDGELLHRLGDRYAVSVYPFVDGHSFAFGPYPDDLRNSALDLIAVLHRATPQVRNQVPRHVLHIAGWPDLDAFLQEPDRIWGGGPFAEGAHGLLLAHAADLAWLAAAFGRLAGATAAARAADPVVTHGEPHPANLLSARGTLLLIDWDTVGLAPPERDLSLIIGETGEGADRYQEVSGRAHDPSVLTLYRARWYLDDLASAVRLFRKPHTGNQDTERWFDGLAPRLARLPDWLGQLG